MKSLNSLSRNVATMVVALLFFVGANLANAQNYVAPQFKTVTVNGGVTGKCSVQIKYQRIANDSNNAAFQKINRANRVDVINQRAATTSDDIAVQDITAEMLDYYVEGLFGEPYHNVSQTATTIRGGRYVQFSTYVETYFGGAHPMIADMCSIYNLSTGNLLDLSYMMTGSYGSTLKRYLYNYLRQELGTFFQVSSLSEMPDPSSCELTEQGIIFIYFPYEVAPFAAGNVRAELTDQQIRNMGIPVRW